MAQLSPHIRTLLTLINNFTAEIVVLNGKCQLLLSQDKDPVLIQEEDLDFFIKREIFIKKSLSWGKVTYKMTERAQNIIWGMIGIAKNPSFIR